MLFSILFAFWRFMEIVTLLPTIGMLAYFVEGYNKYNLMTPNYVLVLFLVSILAAAWAILTIFTYHRGANARIIAGNDLIFSGAMIAAVYYLRFIASADCTLIRAGDSYDVSFGIFGYASFNNLNVNVDKTCAMFKSCFAFGILNCIFFFITAVLAFMHGRGEVVEERRYYHETRHRRGSRQQHSRSGSHHGSRRSSHSHRRSYA